MPVASKTELALEHLMQESDAPVAAGRIAQDDDQLAPGRRVPLGDAHEHAGERLRMPELRLVRPPRLRPIGLGALGERRGAIREIVRR